MADLNQNGEIFSTLEIDTIGEIMNISMGSAATAASTLLDNKVTITTPVVRIIPFEEFHFKQLEPAIAVEIRYVEGISGSNILILRKDDVRKILSQMMMTEMPEDFQIDEMAESAICELMNQMMGSSATVLSCFLGRTINISTPSTVSIDGIEDFKKEHFGENPSILTISFDLSIKDLMDSTFMCAMQIDLAKEIIDVSLNFDTDAGSSADPAPAAEPAPPPAPAPMPQAPPAAAQQAPPMAAAPSAAAPPAAPMQQPSIVAEQPQAPAQIPAQPYGAGYAQPAAPPQYYNPYPPPAYPGMPPQGYGYPPQQDAPIVVKDFNYNDFGGGAAGLKDQPTNLDLVMNVPVVVTVELGRTKRKIKEILEFGQGSVIELDKQAGSHVDVIVNGQLIARGDVVVVDDNFSIRVTEILKSRDSLGMI